MIDTGHVSLARLPATVAAHRAALVERLIRRGHPARRLGYGTLGGAATIDAYLASAATPGAFPAVDLPAERPGRAPQRLVGAAPRPTIGPRFWDATDRHVPPPAAGVANAGSGR